MKKKYILPIVVVLGLGFLFGARLLSGEDSWICSNGEWVEHGKPKAPKPITRCGYEGEIPTPFPSGDVGTGTIEGSLGFPSEGIPADMEVCAESLPSGELTCTTEKIRSPDYTYGQGYKLEVPEGSYYVYATTKARPSYKAYYSEFVTCGLKVGCNSHEAVPIKVLAGEKTGKVDPQDWYKN